MLQTKNIEWIVDTNRDRLNEQAANTILQTLLDTPSPVLGFATGSTPLGLYQNLVRRSVESTQLQARWRDVTGFNLDEYVGLSPDHPMSYHHYMWEQFYQYVPVQRNRIYIPDGAGNLAENCQKYDAALAEHGFADVQILGIGKNGHIGFNEPAPQLELNTHVTGLSESTRAANARFFGALEEVPTEAITIGMAGILNAKQVILLAFGVEKREALMRAFSGTVGTDCPASFLQLHKKVKIFTDQEVP